MAYELRKPNFRVSILRPNYSVPGEYNEEAVLSFDSNPSNRLLIAYTYRQDLASFECPFSLSFTPEPLDDSGETVLERVNALDIVKIEEHGVLKYLGVVSGRRYAAQMTEGGPDRSIVVSGYGVGGILSRFTLLLDQIILADATTSVDSIEKSLRAMVAELSGTYGGNSSMTRIFGKIGEAFRTAMEKVGGFPKGTGIYKVIDEYMSFSPSSDKLTTKYPMALSAFSYGGNTLLEIWDSLVFKPLYEFFIRWDEPTLKYLLFLRPTPFDPAAWLALKNTNISPLHVTACDLGFSDDEVKSWFFAYLSGGSLSYENARYNAQATAVKKDSAKWGLYGYRPLECAFKYLDYAKLKEDKGTIRVSPSTVGGDILKFGGTVSDEKLMEEYSKKLYAWFHRADEMATGSITMMTMPLMPTIGERCTLNKVQYYVEALDGSWSYGAEQSTKLTVTRGAIYNTGYNTGAEESEANWWMRQANTLTTKLRHSGSGAGLFILNR